MSESDSLVERVARAICVEMGLDPDATFQRLDAVGNEFTTPPRWMDHQRIARAAIQAMREPCDAGVKAAVHHALSISIHGDYRWPEYIADLHRIQIDQALSDSEAP